MDWGIIPTVILFVCGIKQHNGITRDGYERGESTEREERDS